MSALRPLGRAAGAAAAGRWCASRRVTGPVTPPGAQALSTAAAGPRLGTPAAPPAAPSAAPVASGTATLRLGATATIPAVAVGALTSKPYAFTSRPWELKETPSVDVMDGVGSNITVYTRGSEVMRILPRLNEEVNEEWISDKARFSYDGLKRQRLNSPMVRLPDGSLEAVSWDKARSVLRNKLLALDRQATSTGATYEAHAVVGPTADTEAMAELRRQFLRWFPAGQLHVAGAATALNTDFRHEYVMNSGLAGLEAADAVLLVGVNPRKEAPLLNVRLRKSVTYGRMSVASIGCAVDLTYPVAHLGHSAVTLREVAEGTHPWCKTLAAARRPAVIVGNTLLARADGPALLAMARDIARHCGAINPAGGWDGWNVLHSGANTVGALDLGMNAAVPGAPADWSATKVLFLLAADGLEGLDTLPDDCLVVYQGHHGDAGAAAADVVLPGAAYTEKAGTYVNTEGRVQTGKAALFPPGAARADVDVLRGLLGTHVPPAEMGGAAAAADAPRGTTAFLAPHLAVDGAVQAADRLWGADPPPVPGAAAPRYASRVPFAPPVDNWYMSEPISRASAVMAKCTRVATANNFDQK